MGTKKIVVVGSVNVDMVVKSKKLPLPGETILSDRFFVNSGGKGANQAVAIARMGGNVTFIAKIGNDTFGNDSLANLKNENIDTDFIFTDPDNHSGVALIMVDEAGENIISVASGANNNLSKTDIDKAMHIIEQADLLLLQLEIPLKTIEYVAKIAYKKGIKVVLNPAPAKMLSNNLLGCLYAIIPNEIEAEMLSGIKITDVESAKQAAEIISSKGVKNVIITLGSKGAFVKEKDLFYRIPAKKCKVIDTTAAGDTFCGTFCVGISEELSISDAVKMANSAARICVTRKGAIMAIPHREEINCCVDLNKSFA